jgi:predicted phosphodiesterase
MEKNKKQILFLGDIHGNFEYVKWYIKAHKIKDCVIYQVGDFGIGFTSEFNDMNTLGNLNKFLVEHNIQMYAIRGNHDNPKFFDGHLANYFGNLHLLADYTVIDIEGTKILGVGGAVSVDRRPRMREQLEYARVGRDIELHWYDEVFVLDEEKLRTFENIDIVVTHTAPDFCAPDNKLGFGYLVEQFARGDQKLYEDLREERNLLTKMHDILKEKNKPDFWFYGHFHRDWAANLDGTNYRLLAINEVYEYRNWKDYEPDWEKDLKEKGTE